MNREIKFRAWEKLEKRIGEVNYIKYSNVQYTQVSARFKQKGKTIDEWFNYGSEDGCDNIILMQYTGLKDKNGTEIFEGDIIKNTYDEFKKVVFLNGSFQLSNIKYPNTNLGLLDGCASFLEVIGNIYENPELLEASND